MMARWMMALGLVLAFGTPTAAQTAQTARWSTVHGGDSSGDTLMIERGVHEGTLRGARTVERLDRTTGYTTGGMTTIVLSGDESEAGRTIRVHLPYGAVLDLAQGDHVSVEASSRLMGLGAVHDVRITRGSTLVVLSTSAAHPPRGITITRGSLVTGSASPRQFGLQVAIARHAYTLVPQQLAYADDMLLSGSETVYGSVRPPDAFEQRIVMAVRIQPLPPPSADS